MVRIKSLSRCMLAALIRGGLVGIAPALAVAMQKVGRSCQACHCNDRVDD